MHQLRFDVECACGYQSHEIHGPSLRLSLNRYRAERNTGFLATIEGSVCRPRDLRRSSGRTPRALFRRPLCTARLGVRWERGRVSTFVEQTDSGRFGAMSMIMAC